MIKKEEKLVIENFEKVDLENLLYKEIIKMLEPLEWKGKYKGNSHHLTQDIVAKVSSAIWEKNTFVTKEND